MKIFKNKILIVTISALLTNALFAGEWYENYENAKKAIVKQRWEQALNLLNRAVADKSKPKSKAKTYGLRFIDYLPFPKTNSHTCYDLTKSELFPCFGKGFFYFIKSLNKKRF